MCYNQMHILFPLSFECRIQMLHAGFEPLHCISMLDPVFGQKSRASGTLSDIFPPCQGLILALPPHPLDSYASVCSCCVLVRMFFAIPGWHFGSLLRPLKALFFDPFWCHSGPWTHALLRSLDCTLLLACFLAVCCVICSFLCSACFT